MWILFLLCLVGATAALLAKAGKVVIDPRPPSARAKLSSAKSVTFSDAVYTFVPEDTGDLCEGCTLVDNVEIEAAQVLPWNLDRIDQAWGLDGQFTPSSFGGEGVDIYVLDSGVRGSHQAFAGRVEPGFDAFGESMQLNDCHSHGTHVSSTALGVGLGVATKARLVPVRVLDCGGKGTLMSLASGTAFVIDNMAKRPKRRAVVNLSIQSAANDEIDVMVRRMYNAGAMVVVAAANFNSDACNYSPAREPKAITVGGTSRDDSKLSSSNFGRCIDLYAPGDEIVGASSFSDTGTTTKRGTSMASPLVAGLLALILEEFPNLTNQEIERILKEAAVILGPLLYDVDCSGSLTGVRLAQMRHIQRRTTYLARGSVLKGSYLHWTGLQTVQSQDISATSPLRMAISTTPLTNGLATLEDVSCIDRSNARWVVYDAVARRVYFSNGDSVAFSSELAGPIKRVKVAVFPEKRVLELVVFSADMTTTATYLVQNWPARAIGALAFTAQQTDRDVQYSFGAPVPHEPTEQVRLEISKSQVFTCTQWFEKSIQFEASFSSSQILYLAASSEARAPQFLFRKPSRLNGIRPLAAIVRRTLRLSTGRRIHLPGNQWTFRVTLTASSRAEVFLTHAPSKVFGLKVASVPSASPYLSLSLSRPGSIVLLL
jgi:subtilisin family serine protease